MKDSKFWIWFIPLFLITCVGLFILLSKNKEENKPQDNRSDSIKIKEEYQKYNNESSYVSVELSDNNAYKYSDNNKTKELLDSSDVIIFLGDPKNNASRKAIVSLNDAVVQTSIPQIYYYDLTKIDDEFTNYLKGKFNVDKLFAGSTFAVQKGNVLSYYYPEDLDNDKSLTDSEKSDLLSVYQNLISDFIDACDDNC